MKNRIVIAAICIEFLVIISIIVFLFLPKGLLFQINPLTKFSIKPTSDTDFQYYYELTPNTIDYGKASWLKEDVIYHYNADGLHERFDYEITKDPRVYRIITLGDSFTFGMWVNTRDNFSEKLEDLLNTAIQCDNIEKFEVINLGVPGFDLRYSLKRFEDKGAKYSPDLIIWFMRGENFILNVDQYRMREKYYKNELLKSGAAEKYHIDSSNQYAASTLAYREYMDMYNSLSEEGQEKIIKSELSSVETISNKYHIPLIILTSTEESTPNKNRIKVVSSKENSIWYDEVAEIDTFHPNDYHPNEGGHRLIAEEALRFYFLNTLTSCHVTDWIFPYP